MSVMSVCFFFQAEDGIRDVAVTGVQTCALPILVKGGGLDKYWTESEVYRCRGGNQQLASRFVTGIGVARVLTRSPVRAVAVSDHGVRVTLAGGKVLEADHVVLTAPPLVWNRIAFDPLLPRGLAPQMGTNVKFLMGLNSSFWRRA